VVSGGLGVYTASYTPTAAGTDNIAITLNGGAIADSPLTSEVSAAAANAARTTASVPAGTAGLPTTVTITVRDANDNVRTAGTDAGNLAVSVSGANTATPTVASAGAGVYTATYTPTATGSDDIAILLNGTAIASSPVTSAVSAGAANAAHTIASVPAGTAGAATTITITVRDVNDNVRSANDDAGLLAVTISGANSAAPSVVSQGAGVYTATYTPTAAGTDQVVIELDGSGIAGSAFTSSVAAGDAAAIEVSGLPDAPDQGTAYDFTLTLRDAAGNVATGYTGTVDFAVAPGTGTVPAGYTFVPGDAGVHTFSAGVTFGSDGAQTLTATDTEHGLTGSRDVTVTPAGP
jgi:hypothetical protein